MAKTSLATAKLVVSVRIIASSRFADLYMNVNIARVVAPENWMRWMQTSNRFFDDIAKVASGAASTLVGVKQEIEALARQQVERFVGEFDLVRRDEFEAAKAVAANACEEQERLERRVTALEEKLQALQNVTEPTGGV